MAANRLRQVAARLVSSVSASVISFATSRPGRVAGKALGLGAAGAATYKGTEYALGETVPYGGGRRRGPEPLWAAVLGGWPEPLNHATAQLVSQLDHPEVLLELGLRGLAPVPAGEVRVHWVRAKTHLSKPLDEVYPEPYRRAVEASMEAVAAALRQEAEEKGFGKHVLKHGFHLVVVPGDTSACSLPSDTVILPLAALNSCLHFVQTPDGKLDYTAAMAALQLVLAHELAHLYLRHAEERRLVDSLLAGIGKAAFYIASAASAAGQGTAVDVVSSDIDVRLMGYQTFASLHKELWWQHEFEADEVACALLARLRLPPEQLAAGIQRMAASQAKAARAYLQARLAEQKKLSPEQKRQWAAELGFPAGDFDAGVALVQHAVTEGDPDAFLRLYLLFEANRVHRRLLNLAKDGGSGSASIGKTSMSTIAVGGSLACPEAGITAVLAELASTHPFDSARVARVRDLSGQLSMLLRATAPPVAVGGRYSACSVAEQVAEQLAAGLAAKDATEAAARAAAEEVAAQRWWWWWWPFGPPAAAAAVGTAEANSPA